MLDQDSRARAAFAIAFHDHHIDGVGARQTAGLGQGGEHVILISGQHRSQPVPLREAPRVLRPASAKLTRDKRLHGHGGILPHHQDVIRSRPYQTDQNAFAAGLQDLASLIRFPDGVYSLLEGHSRDSERTELRQGNGPVLIDLDGEAGGRRQVDVVEADRLRHDGRLLSAFAQNAFDPYAQHVSAVNLIVGRVLLSQQRQRDRLQTLHAYSSQLRRKQTNRNALYAGVGQRRTPRSQEAQ